MKMKTLVATLALAGMIGAAQAEGVSCVSFAYTPLGQTRNLTFEQIQQVEAANGVSLSSAKDKLIPGYTKKLRDGFSAGDGSLLYANKFIKFFRETVLRDKVFELVKTTDQNNDLLCLGTPDELRASASEVASLATVSTSLSKTGGECSLAIGDVMSRAIAERVIGDGAGVFWVNPFQDVSFSVRDSTGKPGILYCPAGGVREQVKALGLEFNLFNINTNL